MKFYVYTDGAARGNPGPSASGYQILDEKHKILVEYSVYNGTRTNNFAEYTAMIIALKMLCSQHGFDNEVILYSDSKVVINQLSGNYKVREESLKPLYKQAHALAIKFTSCEFVNVPRENKYVSRVDKALNELLDKVKKTKTPSIGGSGSSKQGRLF